MQRRQQIVKIVPVPVCPHGAFLRHRLGILHGKLQKPALRAGCGKENLNGIHGFAQVSAAGARNVFQHALFRLSGQSGALFHMIHCPMYRFQRGLLRNLLEFEHSGPAEDGIEHIKIGILRGGSNQRNLAVFNVFQQGLLLLFVKGLNLIQVQQHTVGGHQRIQLAGDLPNVRCGGRGGVELV